MQQIMAITISIIQGKSLSKIVSSSTVRTMISEYLKVTLSAPIDRKVNKLTEIITAQCKMLNHLNADMKILKANTQKLLAHNIWRKERRF